MLLDCVTAGMGALEKAYHSQAELVSLGDRAGMNYIGQVIEKGEGRDKALMGDWASEEAVIKFLRENKFPAIVHAEEHGFIRIVNDPCFTVVLDGFDGSSTLAKDPHASGGTMIAIARGLDPRYEDFVFGGLTERSAGIFVYGVKGRGVNMRHMEDGRLEIVRPFQHERRFGTGMGVRVHLDDPALWGNYEEGITSGLDEIGTLVRDTFTVPLRRSGPVLTGRNSSSSMAFDLIRGDVDAVCGVIGKGAFEPPAEYVMIKELGGVMLAVDMSPEGREEVEDIGSKRWGEYGRPLSPLVRANSELMGRTLWDYVRGNRE